MVIDIMRYIAVILLFGILLFILQGCSNKSETQSAVVKIMVATSAGVVIESDNPLYIKSGDTAEFMLQISEGFKLSGIETVESAVGMLTGNENDFSAVYENGLLRLDNALYPSTLRLNVRPFEYYNYFIENDASIGIVKSDVQTGIVREDTPVTVSAETSEDYIFIGWSNGALLTNGGELLSYSSEYNFALVSDMTIFPNYISKNSQYIKYNANGGVVMDSNSETFYYEIKTHHYPCPNAFGDTGVFMREGYALLEYNTEPDGSGTAVNLGGNVIMGDENIVELFAQWVKYTDASLFTYTESEDETITITEYHGDEEIVVIPEKIDEKPVVSIGSRAFTDKSLKLLFLTKNITTVSSRAIQNCLNLETLYLSDSIIRMQNESVANCPKLANLYINAVTPPRYFRSPGWGSSIKYKRLITATGKRLIVIAGSSSAFGLNSPLLTELLDNEYSIVNYGTHAGTCALFFLEFTTNQIRDGDIVIMAPEPLWESQQGANWVDTLIFYLLEGAYDAFRHVDIRNYTNVFASFADYNSTRRNLPHLTYEDYIPDVNIYGDILTNQANHPESYSAGGQWVSFGNVMTSDGAARLNRINDKILSKGARFYLSYSPVNRNALVSGGDTERRQMTYHNNIVRLVDFPVISIPGNYIFPGNYFSDTDHHLNSVHSADRTIQLAEDILTQFAFELNE